MFIDFLKSIKFFGYTLKKSDQKRQNDQKEAIPLLFKLVYNIINCSSTFIFSKNRKWMDLQIY